MNACKNTKAPVEERTCLKLYALLEGSDWQGVVVTMKVNGDQLRITPCKQAREAKAVREDDELFVSKNGKRLCKKTFKDVGAYLVAYAG